MMMMLFVRMGVFVTVAVAVVSSQNDRETGIAKYRVNKIKIIGGILSLSLTQTLY